MDRYFEISQHGSTVRTEILAGVTTFLTMAYIIFVNPQILSACGMDRDAVFVATCLGAAFGTMVMGLYANLPIALAPGMGLNAYFAFGVVGVGGGGMGFTWQVALGAVFVSGVLFLIISLLPIREAIVNAIPHSLKMAISAGIGFFLAIIGMQHAGLVKAHQVTMVTLGDLSNMTTVLAAVGFIAMVALLKLNIRAAILLSILAVSAIGVARGISPFYGIVDLPPNPSPTLFQLDILGALDKGLIAIVFTFLFVDLFDNTGTMIGVAHRAGLLDKDGRIVRLRQALLADSSSACVGAALGTSTVTSYIESAAGTNAGGRTGLTAVTVAVLFVLALFFAPLARSIPDYATAPALILVACLMARGMTEIDWEDVTEYAPAVVCALAMPFTYSIAHGIAFGFITYAAAKLLTGRIREAHPIVVVLGVLFVAKFWWLG